MALFRRRRVHASEPLSAPALQAALLAQGVPSDATRDEAMQVPAVAGARHMIAEECAGMPPTRYRGDELIGAGWLEQPNPFEASSITWTWVYDDLMFRGQSTLAILARDYQGFPTAVQRLDPGMIIYEPRARAYGYQWYQQVFYEGVEVPELDLIVIPGPHEGFLNFGATIISSAQALEAAAMRLADVPLAAQELHQTGGEQLTAAQAADMVQQYAAARRLGGVAYTSPALQVIDHGWNATELQLVEARETTARQVARALNIPAGLLSAPAPGRAELVYANISELNQRLLDQCLDPYLRAVEERLSMNDVTPRGQKVVCQRDAFTRPSFWTVRVPGWVSLIGAGVVSADYVAQVEEQALPPHPQVGPAPADDVTPAPTSEVV